MQNLKTCQINKKHLKPMYNKYPVTIDPTSIICWLAPFFLSILAPTAFADSTYRCRMNAHASRDYHYSDSEPSWCAGVSNCGKKVEFEITMFPEPNFSDFSYREYLISLPQESAQVTIKSFWAEGDDGNPVSEEFQANIISRDGPVLFFIYKNPTGNKIHTFALNVRHKKLVATSVINGLTSLVVDAKTYDCQ